MGARKVLAVAGREFRHTVLTKAFLFAIVGLPILIAGVGVVAGLIMAGHKEPPLVGTVVVVDGDGAVSEATQARFDRKPESAIEEVAQSLQATGPVMTIDPGAIAAAASRGEVKVAVENVRHEAPSIDESLRARVRSGELLAVIAVPRALVDPPAPDGEPQRFAVLFRDRLDSDHIRIIERRAAEAIVDVRVARSGRTRDELDRLLSRPEAASERMRGDGTIAPEDSELAKVKSMMLPMAFMMLLWISTFAAGNQLLMTTIEEKSNRVMEVLLSAISPTQLLAGKILGQGVVGLILVTVYGGLGIAGLIAAASADLVAPLQLVAFGIYFLMGFFMVASLLAAVGSAVNDLREANSLMTPVMLILIAPLMLWMPISQAPNGAIATIFSFIPPAIPFVMILRVTAEEAVPLWQVIATIVWGGVSTLAMIWGAGRVFRIGVLMQGKPPSPIELLRWIRRG